MLRLDISQTEISDKDDNCDTDDAHNHFGQKYIFIWGSDSATVKVNSCKSLDKKDQKDSWSGRKSSLIFVRLNILIQFVSTHNNKGVCFLFKARLVTLKLSLLLYLKKLELNPLQICLLSSKLFIIAMQRFNNFKEQNFPYGPQTVF